MTLTAIGHFDHTARPPIGVIARMLRLKQPIYCIAFLGRFAKFEEISGSLMPTQSTANYEQT